MHTIAVYKYILLSVFKLQYSLSWMHAYTCVFLDMLSAVVHVQYMLYYGKGNRGHRRDLGELDANDVFVNCHRWLQIINCYTCQVVFITSVFSLKHNYYALFIICCLLLSKFIYNSYCIISCAILISLHTY